MNAPRYKINTPAGYQKLKERLSRADKYFENKSVTDPNEFRNLRYREAIAVACLEWEMKNNLLKDLP